MYAAPLKLSHLKLSLSFKFYELMSLYGLYQLYDISFI